LVISLTTFWHSFHESAICIAIPTENSSLEWKKPSQCVWDDAEFTQNGLKLQSKVAMKHLIEKHTPDTTRFFTELLKIPNAGIDELLDDLKLLQQTQSNASKIVFRLYERIQTYCRSSAAKIKYAQLHEQLLLANLPIDLRSQQIH
jgi:hypothetical protein